MIRPTYLLSLCCFLFLISCSQSRNISASQAQLIKQPFKSFYNETERNYYVYLPKGYAENKDKQWPILLFLHGNGERGNGLDELDYVLIHGPLYEAWIQKRDLSFIIIAPQLPMFGMDEKFSYIKNRTINSIPKRLNQGVPPRPKESKINSLITREYVIKDMNSTPPLLPLGWEQIEYDLLTILSHTEQHYRTDPSRVYLSGISYGGFGTWYMASKHPDLFAAIVPVVGWGHPTFMAPIAQIKTPIWAFAGGLDNAVPIKYFYAGINKLKNLGHDNIRFTVHEDMGHDTWRRVYSGQDIYNWLLNQKNTTRIENESN